MNEIIQNSTVIDTVYYEIVWCPLAAAGICLVICFCTRLILCLNNIIKNRAIYIENTIPFTTSIEEKEGKDTADPESSNSTVDEDEDEPPTYKEMIN